MNPSTKKTEIDRYTSAKVLLLGDSGTGKSGLAIRLLMNEFHPTESTHGIHISHLNSQTIIEKGVSVVREIVLWDLAGQQDYRIVHQLFITGAAVALVVADPSEEGWWQSAKNWNRSILRIAGPECRRILVLSRADRGAPRDEISSIVEASKVEGFSGLFVTSAKTGEGIQKLLEGINEAIPWDELPITRSPLQWIELRMTLRTKAERNAVLSIHELHQLVGEQITKNELDAFLRVEESKGELFLLRSSSNVLLRIEYLNKYASLIVLNARRHPEGLGCVVTSDAINGQLPGDADQRLSDPEQDKILFREATELLLAHGLALRVGRHLVLPSMVSRSEVRAYKRNEFQPEVEYSFEGSVDVIYAVLATRLSYSAIFELDVLYRQSARFLDPLGRICQFVLKRIDETHGLLSVSFETATPDETRALFCLLITEYLSTRVAAGSLEEKKIVCCDSCGYIFDSDIVDKRVKHGKTFIHCPICDTQNSLVLSLDNEINSKRLRSRVENIERKTDERIREALVLLRAEFESNVTQIPGIDKGSSEESIDSSLSLESNSVKYDTFISYSRKDSEIILKIARNIRDYGLRVWFDEWCIRPGVMFQDAIESALPESKTIAVFIGKSGLNRWELIEMRVAVSLFVERNLPVIPCFLPGVDNLNLPLFLREFQGIKFRSDDDIDAFGSLKWAITGIRPRNLT